jgi:branched-chain amino acid transport system ATP-binding protein
VGSLLELEGVTAGYGESIVLDDVSVDVGAGETLAVLGRNGVGKTTLVVTIMGLTRLHRGKVHYRGRDLTALRTFERAQSGLGWVPQERGMFPSLTVEQHLTAVARPGYWNVARIYARFPRLRERRSNLGNQLSGGEQQLLAFARALMVNPKLLLLDEPFEGLAPKAAGEMATTLRDLAAEAEMAMVLVEQHPRLALLLTERAIVLDRGRIVHEGCSMHLLAEPAHLRRFLAVSQ